MKKDELIKKVLESCVEDLESLHPMDPNEPCIIYEVWRNTKDAIDAIEATP